MESGHRIEFDVFISHASEDKDSFVRSLAKALEVRRLHPWYDEFTLRPGDSLRRSIDHGLLTSQAGVVVLSPAFFSKRWTNYELDGLVQLNAGDPQQVTGSRSGSRLIPVWHNVDVETVARYSPSLANLVALRSSDGIAAVADRILALLRPGGSALLFAYEELSQLGERVGWHPPVVTDDWWLDAIETSAKVDLEGTSVLETESGRYWGFPLPEHSVEPRARGHRLAWAAAQMTWQRARADRKISQVTPPDDVLDFINSSPGLAEACLNYPSYMLGYAPQLALPGSAGGFQETVDATYAQARDDVREAGIDPDSQEGMLSLIRKSGYLALRNIALVALSPHGVALAWIQWRGIGAPGYKTLDYAGWLVSESSQWLNDYLRSRLLYGIAFLGAWPRELQKGPKGQEFYLTQRLTETSRKLELAETGEELANRLVTAGLLEWDTWETSYYE